MSAALYRSFKKLLLDGDIDLLVDTIKAVLVTSSYTFSQAHDFRDDLGANTLGTAVTLASKTTNSPNPGTFDCADLVFTSVPTGTVAAIVFYKDAGGLSSADPLIFYDDSITGFPLSTNGGDVTVTIDSGSDRLFTL